MAPERLARIQSMARGALCQSVHRPSLAGCVETFVAVDRAPAGEVIASAVSQHPEKVIRLQQILARHVIDDEAGKPASAGLPRPYLALRE